MANGSTSPAQKELTLVNCVQCGRELNVEINRVLDIGRENLICMDCAESNQAEGPATTTGQTDTAEGGVVGFLRGLGNIILQIALAIGVVGIAIAVLSIVAPSLFGLDVVSLMTTIAGVYILYLGHTEHSWLAAVVGFWVTIRSIIGFIGAVGVA